MSYLLAQCPMFGCNFKNVVCTVPGGVAPHFEAGVYVVVKCSNCGQVFREMAARLEPALAAPSKARRNEDSP